MTEAEYTDMLSRYDCIREEIERNTVREGEHYVVSYTKIITDIPGFHKDLERFEIYNGRKPLQELEQIILERYRRFHGTGYLFECSFMQNIIEDLILFHQLEDEEILEFYRKLFDQIQKEDFLLLYLYMEDLEESTNIIRKERSDAQGKELWYSLMMEFLVHSPYGTAHGYREFADLVAHFRHRQQLEMRIVEEVLGEHALVLPAKKWNLERIEEKWN